MEAPAPSRIPKWPLLVGVAIAMALVIGGVAVATSKAGNKSGYNRGEEASVIEDWLRARGFVLTAEAQNAKAESALAGN